MNRSRYIIFGLIVFMVLFVLAMPDPEVSKSLQPADLPWKITKHEDGSTEVFKLKPGISLLQQVIDRFQEPEELAVYRGNEKSTLEAYFGTIKIGPLEAKLVVTLKASEEEIQHMLEQAKGLSLTNSADKKIKLSHDDEITALQRTITGITFIPKYSGLDSDFFKERFGEPASWLRINDQAVQYFYPDQGLSIVIDSDGKEILQYSHPAGFTVPDEAVINDDNNS